MSVDRQTFINNKSKQNMKNRINNNQMDRTELSCEEHIERMITAISLYRSYQDKVASNPFDEPPKFKEIILYVYDMFDDLKKKKEKQDFFRN